MSSTNDLDSQDDAELLDRIVDEVLKQQRGGVHPNVNEYIARYPRLAEQLLEIFPALSFAEQIGTSSRFDLKETSESNCEEFPKEIGDYELIQEIGRGGMGVVFAARQISLDRTVALKLLSRHLSSNPQLAKRFLRESMSAAKLQHPNIVAVYGNGSANGFSFYAMQLIDGQNLREILHAEKNEHAKLETPSPGGHELSSTISIKGHSSGHASLEHFKQIAAMGYQVAMALDYAHAHGCVHRDIKPSNLLVERSGRVWVADFGLAKVDNDENLTLTGDLLGTLRYAAPEQLEGVTSPSCDIYGLGATLYEMVTLQPAFNYSQNAELLERIRNETPARPRSLRPSVPRDLETIITTAMQRDPRLRYRTASDLGQDLERFRYGMPIKARQTSTFQAVYRWARRNRLTAATLLLAWILSSIVIPGLMLAYSIRLRNEVDRSQRAERQTSVAKAGFQHQLAESLILTAQAERSKQTLESRANSQSALLRAFDLMDTDLLQATERQSTFQRLRNEMVAALALPDFRKSLPIPIHGSFDNGRVLVAMAGDSLVFSEHAADGTVHLVVAQRDSPLVATQTIQVVPDACQITNNEQHLVTLSDARDGLSRLAVWDAPSGDIIWETRIPPHRYSLSHNDRVLCFLDTDGSLRSFDLATQTLGPHATKSVTIADDIPLLAIDANGDRVALIYVDSVRIVRLENAAELATIALTPTGIEFETGFWSPAENWFATKTVDGVITLYDTHSWQVLRTFACDKIEGTRLSASLDGRYLATQTWTKRLMLWDVQSGAQILNFKTPVVSPFLRLNEMDVGPIASPDKAEMWELLPSQYYRQHAFALSDDVRPECFALDPSSSNIAVSLAYSFRLCWLDSETGETQSSNIEVKEPFYDATGALWAIADSTITKFRVESGEAMRLVPELQLEGTVASCFGIDSSGHTVAYNANGGVTVLRLNGDSVQSHVHKAWGDVRRIEVSRDGRWIVGAGHNKAGCFVFDVGSEKQWNLAPDSVLTVPRFSPDGSYLALTVPGNELRLYRTGDWELPLQTWPNAYGQPVFSPDGRTLAASLDTNSISLIDLETHDISLRLEHPGGETPGRTAYSTDGSRLFYLSAESNAISEWRIDACLQELKRLGL